MGDRTEFYDVVSIGFEVPFRDGLPDEVEMFGVRWRRDPTSDRTRDGRRRAAYRPTYGPSEVSARGT